MTDHMTNEQLRREIAEAQGYRLTVEDREYEDCTGMGDVETIKEYVIYDPNGKEVTYRYYGRPNLTENDAWNVPGVVPNWPSDHAAAHALCLEIALPNNWSVSVTPYSDGTFVAEFVHAKTDEHIAYAIGDAPAEVLSRLAHVALKAQAVRHD